MSQSGKAALYRALKENGVTFSKHYRDYTTEELSEAYSVLAAQKGLPPIDTTPSPPVTAPHDDVSELRQQLQVLTQVVTQLVQQRPQQAAPVVQAQPSQPAAKPAPQRLDPAEHAGVTLNTHKGDEPVEIDQHGNVWFQKEVNKPGYPKPRGRRVLRDMDPGVVKESIKVGDYIETFEIPGDPRNAKPIEIKVTLPSYQTGIYKAPGLPFKIHTYNGNRAFDWDDVNAFYGGADLVPDKIKHVYVSSDLCYDIQTTIRAINDEYRERVLKKETI